MGNIFKF